MFLLQLHARLKKTKKLYLLVIVKTFHRKINDRHVAAVQIDYKTLLKLAKCWQHPNHNHPFQILVLCKSKHTSKHIHTNDSCY